jgi:class 3 adenylate cyclase
MTGPREEVSDTILALVVFGDIVDSSKYSAVLGYSEYAKRLQRFQKLFRVIGRRYFPEPVDRTQELCDVEARGDEGTVFLARTGSSFKEPLMRAIEFLYHVKGLLRFGLSEGSETSSPSHLGLGAGIHIGRVAYLTKIESDRSIISRLEGFSINYAKRVESASRLGRYSRIFLSKEAAKLLEDKPVALSPVTASMKGIEESAELYEVRSGLLCGLKLKPDDYEEDENMIRNLQELVERPDDIEGPWVKSLIVSVMEWLLQQSPVRDRKIEYHGSQLHLAWHSMMEDDPILLYVRAMESEGKKEYYQQLRYLKDILDKYPDFVHARKQLIGACLGVAKMKVHRPEMVLARDLAKEFLEKFPNSLSEEEKKELRKLLRVMNKKMGRA